MNLAVPTAARTVAVQTFTEWQAALLKHLALPPAPKPAPAVISLHFGDKPKVHIMGKAGQISLMSEAGSLSAPYGLEIVLDLLALNRCDGDNDAVSVTLDKASGTVIVWARQRQQSLDMAAGTKLVQAIRGRVDEVQKIIGRSSRQMPQRGAAMLARMLANR